METPRIVATERELDRQAESAVLDIRCGRYREGLDHLDRVFRDSSAIRELPVRLFPDYAVALAAAEKRFEEARELCRLALAREPRDAEHWANLARVEALSGNRAAAVEALRKSEDLEPTNLLAERLWVEIGRRAIHPVPFLARDSRVNVIVGRWLRKAA